MSRTTSFGPSVSIRPSNLARAVNVNTPEPSPIKRAVNVNTPKPSPIKRAVNVNTPAPAATPKTSTPRPPFTSYRGGNISPVTGCPAGQISIAGTCVAIPTYSTPASNSPAAAMQTIRDKICADQPNNPICKLTNQTPAESRPTPAESRSLQARIGLKTLPVTKPYPAASSVQAIRDKICAENPEACKPYPIDERGLPIAPKKLQRKYCEDHPDSELCKIGDRPVPASPASEQPNNEPGTPANTNPPANVPDSSASG